MCLIKKISLFFGITVQGFEPKSKENDTAYDFSIIKWLSELDEILCI